MSDPRRTPRDINPPETPAEGTTPGEPRVWTADQLFAGVREVVIDHGGERYRLRITRRGRLILTK